MHRRATARPAGTIKARADRKNVRIPPVCHKIDRSRATTNFFPKNNSIELKRSTMAGTHPFCTKNSTPSPPTIPLVPMKKNSKSAHEQCSRCSELRGSLEEGELLLNIQADFCCPIGGIVIFVPDGASPRGVLQVLHGVPSPAVVSHRQQNLLYHELTALIPASVTASSSDPSLVDVSRGMCNMVTEAKVGRNNRSDAREVARLPRTARDHLGYSLTDSLLLMCRVNDDSILLQVYHEWAARPRGVSERYTLQQSVDAAATILNVPSFEVTPTHVMAFKNVRYAGSSYFNIGSGLLPFSITPADATSVQAWAMLATDRVRSDAFELRADPEIGAVAPGEVSRLRNLSGYTPQSWNEARSQLLEMQTLRGALLGPAHPVVGAYSRFLWRYSRMLARLEFEIDHVHGWRLGPSIMMFYVQLAWRNWMVVQLESGETESIDPPYFGAGLSMLETQNNLMWLPSVTNVPLLPNLSLGSRTPMTAPVTLRESTGARTPSTAWAPAAP
jgi:hypothetical protein